MPNLSKVTLYLQREGYGVSHDDIIQIFDHDNDFQMYKIVYKTPETKKHAVFFMTRNNTMNYVIDLLKALKYDTDPFTYIQVSTRIHPSIQFQIPDLHDNQVRYLIEDMIYAALRNMQTEARQ